jgi:integrase
MAVIEPYVPETREQELERMFNEASKRVASGEAGSAPASDKNGDMKPLLTGLAAKNAMDAVMLPPRAKDPLDDVLDTAMNGAASAPAAPVAATKPEEPSTASQTDEESEFDEELEDDEELDETEDDLDDEDDFDDESESDDMDEDGPEEDDTARAAAPEPAKKAPEIQEERRKPEPQSLTTKNPDPSPPPQAPVPQPPSPPQVQLSQATELALKKEVADLRATLEQSRSMFGEMRNALQELSKKDVKIKEVEDLRNMLSASQGTLAETQTALTEIKKTIHGIGEKGGSKQKKPILPLMPSDLSKIMRKAPQSALWLRDRAMILLCFSGALRPTEVISVRLEGISFMRFRNEFHFTYMSRSRGRLETRVVNIVRGPLCVAEAVARWINASGITYGYLFRKVLQSGVDKDWEAHLKANDVTKAVKKAVALIGLDPDHYDWHSLRKGYVKVVQEISRRSRDADAIRDNMQPVIAEE